MNFFSHSNYCLLFSIPHVNFQEALEAEIRKKIHNGSNLEINLIQI